MLYHESNSQNIRQDFSLLDPVPGSIMVQWLSEPVLTAGGIARPDSSLRWEVVGDVLALGKKTNTDFVNLAVGDRVLANSLWGTSVWEGEVTDDDGESNRRSCRIRIIGWNEVIAKERKPADLIVDKHQVSGVTTTQGFSLGWSSRPYIRHDDY